MTVIDSFISNIRTTLTYIRFVDYLDIALVAYGIYQAIRLVRNTRAAQLLKGIVFIIVLLFVSDWFNLIMVNYILVNTVQVGLIAIIILFTPEFRHALERVGRSNLSKIFTLNEERLREEEIHRYCRIIADTCSKFSATRTGALIVIQRETKLDDIVKTGVHTNADLSAELLQNIFIKDTPLHDGAVVMQNFRIVAAACFLPLTQNPNLASDMGTRHRSAIGMSENADCIVLVVSEETGGISIARDGLITRGYSADGVYDVLFAALRPIERKKKRADDSSADAS